MDSDDRYGRCRLGEFLHFLKCNKLMASASSKNAAQFLDWLESSGISLDEVTKSHLGQYEIKLASSGSHWRAITGKMNSVQRFLLWLIENDLLDRTQADLGLYRAGDAITSEYIASAGKQWSSASRDVFQTRISKFNKWLEASGINIANITCEDLCRYEAYLSEPGISESSLLQYRQSVHTFLRWLAANKILKTCLIELGLEKSKFQFLQEHHDELTLPHPKKMLRIYVRLFYEWLKGQNVEIADVRKEHVIAYQRHLRGSGRSGKSVGTRRDMMRYVCFHLRWLISKGHINRSCAELGISKGKHKSLPKTTLPEHARKFLSVASAHKRPKTIAHYSTRLRHFYRFLQERQISISKLTRHDLEEFMKNMGDEQYAPQTRRLAIGVVQIYLSWLYECQFIKKDPEPLIANFPRPKLPDRLPRILPKNADDLLQSILKKNLALP